MDDFVGKQSRKMKCCRGSWTVLTILHDLFILKDYFLYHL